MWARKQSVEFSHKLDELLQVDLVKHLVVH